MEKKINEKKNKIKENKNIINNINDSNKNGSISLCDFIFYCIEEVVENFPNIIKEEEYLLKVSRLSESLAINSEILSKPYKSLLENEITNEEVLNDFKKFILNASKKYSTVNNKDDVKKIKNIINKKIKKVVKTLQEKNKKLQQEITTLEKTKKTNVFLPIKNFINEIPKIFNPSIFSISSISSTLKDDEENYENISKQLSELHTKGFFTKNEQNKQEHNDNNIQEITML